jgi:phosphatidylserine decarboxylase
MSVFDVHINRAPISGRVKRIAYVPGKFINADLDKASEDNERQAFTLALDGGRNLGVVQIAGLIARRIVRFVSEGERLVAGQRIGLIRFGSRVDVYLPAGVNALVMIGQRAIAGETVIADLSSAEAERLGRRS